MIHYFFIVPGLYVAAIITAIEKLIGVFING